MTESSSMRDSQLTKDSDESSLPYLQPDPEPVMPEPRPAIPPREPTTRTTPPPFPRVIPPSLSSFQAPSSPSSPEYMGPPRNYHPEALAIVGGYPPIKQGGPAPYPVMMMQPGGPPGRASMPVEQVMAKYGQALLPDEQYRPPEKFRPMSSPAPPSRNKLQRPSARRTRSDIPNPLSPNGEQTPSVTGDPFSLRTDPPIEQQQPQSPELSKRPASMPRKLTKKRPASAQAMGSESPQFPQERFDPLPDVLFHGKYLSLSMVMISAHASLVRATQDYEMQAYDELSFATGAVLAVKSTHENGRWFGYVVGSSEKPQEGVFHRTYVNILQRMDSSKTKGNILLNGRPFPCSFALSNLS